MATYNNFVIKQGADWVEVIVWKKPDGTLVDISGLTDVKLEIREAYPSSVQETMSVQGVYEVSEYSYGKLRMYLPRVYTAAEHGIYATLVESKLRIHALASSTALIPAGKYVYDLEVVISGETTRLLEGEITVTPQVTV